MANGRNNSRADAGPLVLVAAMLHLHLDLAVRRIGANRNAWGFVMCGMGKVWPLLMYIAHTRYFEE